MLLRVSTRWCALLEETQPSLHAATWSRRAARRNLRIALAPEPARRARTRERRTVVAARRLAAGLHKPDERCAGRRLFERRGDASRATAPARLAIATGHPRWLNLSIRPRRRQLAERLRRPAAGAAARPRLPRLVPDFGGGGGDGRRARRSARDQPADARLAARRRPARPRREHRAAAGDRPAGDARRRPSPSTACRPGCTASSTTAPRCWRRSAMICARRSPRCACGPSSSRTRRRGRRSWRRSTRCRRWSRRRSPSRARRRTASRPGAVDLAALVESIVEDARRRAAATCRFEPSPPSTLTRCRPVALARRCAT